MSALETRNNCQAVNIPAASISPTFVSNFPIGISSLSGGTELIARVITRISRDTIVGEEHNCTAVMRAAPAVVPEVSDSSVTVAAVQVMASTLRQVSGRCPGARHQ